MAKKKTTKRKSRAQKTPKLQQVGPFVPALLAGMLVLILLGGAAMLQGELAERARARRIAEPIEIVVYWPADVGQTLDSEQSWVPLDQQQDLLTLIRSQLQSAPDPLSIDGLRAAGDALARSGWFESTPTLRRHPDGSIELQGEWRVPRAWIRSENVDYLVDTKGRLMPLMYGSDRTSPARTPIVNPGMRPPRTPQNQPDFERVWASATVWSAIELLDLLRTQPYWAQVDSVDAGGLGSDANLTIVTDRQSRITWGAGPSGFHPGERPTKEKLFHLSRFYAEEEFGRHIDAGMGGYDLRSGYIVLDRTMTHADDE